ncbi:hypothetical protein D3C85_915850 [compost metagenome]
MQIEITKRTETKETVEIEFPVYREHCIDGDGWSTSLFTRINADLTYVQIEVKDDEMEIEIGKNYRFTGSDSNYLLGRGMYSCSAIEFERVLCRAEEFFANAVAIGRQSE